MHTKQDGSYQSFQNIIIFNSIFCWNIIVLEKSYFPLQILQISFLIKHLPASLYFELLGLRTNTLILIGLTVFYRMQLDIVPFEFYRLQHLGQGLEHLEFERVCLAPPALESLSWTWLWVDPVERARELESSWWHPQATFWVLPSAAKIYHKLIMTWNSISKFVT